MCGGEITEQLLAELTTNENPYMVQQSSIPKNKMVKMRGSI